MRKFHSKRGRWPMAVAAIAGSVMLAAPPAPAATVAGWSSGIEARDPSTGGTYDECITATNPAGFNAQASLTYPDPSVPGSDGPNGVLTVDDGGNSYSGPVTVEWQVLENWDNPDGTTSDPTEGSCEVGYNWAVSSGSITGSVVDDDLSISCTDLVEGTSGSEGFASGSLYSRPTADDGGGEQIVLQFSHCTLNGDETGSLTFTLFDAAHAVCVYGQLGPTQCAGNYVITEGVTSAAA